MPVQVLMPALSPTMTNGKVLKWNVNVGDDIEIGKIIAEVETDKTVMDLEAFEDGRIGKILVEAGTENVAVNSPIAIILFDGETEDDLNRLLSDSKIEEAQEELGEKEKILEDQEIDLPSEEIVNDIEDYRVKASPVAKSIAKNNKISLNQIKIGTGPYGRVVKKDVLEFIANSNSTVEMHNTHSEVSTIRSIIAERLVKSKQGVPHFYLTVECNLDKMIFLRKEINIQDIKITINDFIIKATGLALNDFPSVNSSWSGGGKIQHYDSVDVAVAVSLDDGLITPIVKNVDTKQLKVVSSEIKSLIIKAKNGTLSTDEYQGGGITISNLGMFGIKDFISIINPPQSSILAVGTTEERAIVHNGEIKIATMMTMTLSVDHRVIDGAVGAQFLNKIKYYLENPLRILLS